MTIPSPRRIFAAKAEKYARYRWDYAPQAVETIFTQASLTYRSVVADLGAGTGILTRHFLGRVKGVLAVEPDLNMLRHAPADNCLRLTGQAEAIPLPSASVDVICVATAIHWFEPFSARAEMQRVLKPGGWLALVINNSHDEAIGQALSQVSTPENGVEMTIKKPGWQKPPLSFYFNQDGYQQFQFPFSFSVDWETFMGAQTSTSYMPDEDHPLYPRFEAACREIFERFSTAGRLPVNGHTELLIGRMG